MAGYRQIVDTGTIVPDTASLLSDVENEFRIALGATIDVDAATPQGALIGAETTARAFVMHNNAELANMFNPSLSFGTYLDSISALTGVDRGKNTTTVVQGVLFTGNPTTTIPAGARVKSDANDLFTVVSQVIIPPAGNIRAAIQSVEYGDIPLADGPMQIVDGVIGWGGVTVDGSTTRTPGTTALADAPLKIARLRQLASLGRRSVEAIYAAVDKVANVRSLLVIENDTGLVDTVDGIAFTKGNAVWVCVDGGDDLDVANAMYSAKTASIPWDYGTASGVPVLPPNGVQVTDPNSLRQLQVKFTRPVMYDAYARIEVRQVTTSADPTVAVQNAISDYANGLLENEEGLVIGASVSAYEYAGAVSRQLPGMYVKNCKVIVVPAGDSAPVYPTGFSDEALIPAFGRAIQLKGNVEVVLVP